MKLGKLLHSDFLDDLKVDDRLNPFVPNGMSHPYQLDESILNLRVVFQIHPKFKGMFCKQTGENLIRRHVLQHLIWFCTVWACPLKWRLHLYGLTLRVTWRFGITKIISLITIGPVKQKNVSVKLRLFSYPSVKTCVLCAQKNHLIETFFLSAHNICFG